MGLSLSLAAALFAGFLLSVVFTPVLIPLLKKLKFGQQVRAEGNPDHLKKQGTPTMGGLVFVPVMALVGLAFTLLFPDEAPADKTVPVILLTVALGLVGFLDDYLKVIKKKSEGLKAWQKLIFQIVIAAGFAVYCYLTPSIGDGVLIPFGGGAVWHMGWLYIPFVIIAVTGTDNGTNFTDGLDGLLASVTIVAALFLTILGQKTEDGVSYLALGTAGALMGYLLYNAYPASVFMGDTGSLAIGGMVSGIAVVTGAGWFLLIFGLVYMVEVLSVMMQVSYFKLTHGKRIFKMAPIHHHFELCGLKETRVVVLFTVVTLLMCAVAYLALL